LVLNQGFKGGQKEKCLSRTRRAKKEIKKMGKEGEGELVNNKGKGRGEINNSRNGSETGGVRGRWGPPM